MNVHRHFPRYPLSEYIQHVVYVCGSTPVKYLKEIPTGGINLVIELNENTSNIIYQDASLQNPISIRHAWISGMQKQAIVYKNNLNSTIISIRFTVGGFFSLTNIPVPALTWPGIQAEAVLGTSFQQLYQRLINSTSVSDMFGHIDAYFLQVHKNSASVHEVIKFIGHNIDKPIKWLIHKSGYSQKHIISKIPGMIKTINS